MNKDELVKYCTELLIFLTTEQLEAIKKQVDKNIELYEGF